jgi:hypothetical protein
MKEYQELSGLRKNAFKKKHETKLEYYAEYRDKVKAVMPKDMKISKPYIDKQLAWINGQQKQIQQTSNMAMSNLARLSVLIGDLREIENEHNHKHHEIEHTKRKDLLLYIILGRGIINMLKNDKSTLGNKRITKNIGE